MGANTASIRELRTDFRGVKRRIEQHGEVVITDHGQPVYVLKPLAQRPKQSMRSRDYYARLQRRQSQPLSPKETRRFWDEERR